MGRMAAAPDRMRPSGDGSPGRRPVSCRAAPRARLVAGACATALLLAGCSVPRAPADPAPTPTAPTRQDPPASATPRDPPVNALPSGSVRRWVLFTLQDADGRVRNPTPAPTLDLLDPGRLRGSDGCNSFSGRLDTVGAGTTGAGASGGPSVGIAVAGLVSTERSCAATNGIERRYLRVVQDAERLTVAGTRLYLRAGEAALVFDVDRMASVQPVQPDDP